VEQRTDAPFGFVEMLDGFDHGLRNQSFQLAIDVSQAQRLRVEKAAIVLILLAFRPRTDRSDQLERSPHSSGSDVGRGLWVIQKHDEGGLCFFS